MKKNDLRWIGAHTSAAGGPFNALLEGAAIGATCIQFFTSNQKRWQGANLTQDTVLKWNRALQETNLSSIMSHDSYLINLGAVKEEVLAKSLVAFRQEIERCHLLKVDYLNFHPGAATTDSEEACLERIAASLLEMEPITSLGSTRLLLETTAGQGSTVGYRFEHLAYLIEKVGGKIPLGVCIDTCHIFAAGYDVRSALAWDKTLKEFDQIIGLEHLFAFHLNDSLKGLGSRVDRHAALGLGEIGLDCFRFLMNDKRVCHLPMYLETPGGPPLWEKEIALLRSFIGKDVDAY